MALSKRHEADAAAGRGAARPISIISSRSTTASAMPSATACCRFSPRAASAKLGPLDLIGRLGGEEFAIVLYDAGRDKGARHRRAHPLAFDDAAAEVDGHPVGGDRQHRHGRSPRRNLFDIPALLAQADEALYCAKERGRNRTEVASLELVLDRAREAEQRRPCRARARRPPARPSARIRGSSVVSTSWRRLRPFPSFASTRCSASPLPI